MSGGQLKTAGQARPRKEQHRSPCTDCPFARKSLRAWLGRMSPEEWMQAVHGEALVDCHTVSNQQCAGSAIYRANVCKSPRRSDALRLPANPSTVFGSRAEFMAHHSSFESAKKDAPFKCPSCGMEFDEQEPTYECADCGRIGFSCCVPGNHSRCTFCEDEAEEMPA